MCAGGAGTKSVRDKPRVDITSGRVKKEAAAKAATAAWIARGGKTTKKGGVTGVLNAASAISVGQNPNPIPPGGVPDAEETADIITERTAPGKTVLAGAGDVAAGGSNILGNVGRDITLRTEQTAADLFQDSGGEDSLTPSTGRGRYGARFGRDRQRSATLLGGATGASTGKQTLLG